MRHTAEQWDKEGFSDLKAFKVTKHYVWSENGYTTYAFEPDGKDSKGQLAPAQCVDRLVADGVAEEVPIESLEDEATEATAEKPKGKKGGKK
jgi:hypothetical protein